MTEHAGGLGDAPIDPRFHRKMNGLARALDEWFNGSLRGKEAEANQLRAEIAKAREAAGRTLAGRPALAARSREASPPRHRGFRLDLRRASFGKARAPFCKSLHLA
jgi:hypothetical protein